MKMFTKAKRSAIFGSQNLNITPFAEMCQIWTENHFSLYPRYQYQACKRLKKWHAIAMSFLLISGKAWTKLPAFARKKYAMLHAGLVCNFSARRPGKAGGQGGRARLPGKAVGQGCVARLQYAESLAESMEKMEKMDNIAVF
jgi:hypothetical protein